MPEKNPKYDLEERTARFGEAVILFARKIPIQPVTQRIIPQLVAAGTSIGSNYCEADDAESSKDFVHKLGICKKEARETKHWLRMISTAVPELKAEARILWQEANELNLIFKMTIELAQKMTFLLFPDTLEAIGQTIHLDVSAD